MANEKNKVIVYPDWISIFDALKDDEAGRLIKHFFAYVNDQNPDPPDRLTEMLFIPIKNQLKRDLSKWLEIKEKRREAGKKGGKQTQAKSSKPKQNQANALKSEANQAVTVTVTDNVTVTDTLLKKETKEIYSSIDDYSFFEFWEDYGKKVGKDKCSKRFERLSKKEKIALKRKVREYVESTPDIQYRKNPLTYLNGRHWEDELNLSEKTIILNDEKNGDTKKTDWRADALRGNGEVW